MKIGYLILFIVLCGTCDTVFGQTAYYDAVKLGSYITTNANGAQFDGAKEKEVDTILSKYVIGFPHQKIKDIYKNNPFIKGYLPESWTNSDREVILNLMNSRSLSTAANSDLSSNPGPNVTNIANGIAQFMINRVKEELTIAFFNRFKKFADDHKEFQILFPKTYSNLTTIPSYNFQEWLPALRTGFYDDVKNMTARLDGIFNLPDFIDLSQKFPEISVAIKMVSLIDNIKSGKLSLPDGLNKLASFPEIANNATSPSIDFQNFANGVKLAAIFSQAIRTPNTVIPSSGWITLPELTSLVRNTTTFNIFLGLIYQEVSNEHIDFSHPDPSDPSKPTKVITVKLSDIMSKSATVGTAIRDDLNKFLSMTSEVNNLETGLNKTGKITNDDYYNYINSAIDVIEFGFDIAGQFDLNLAANTNKYVAVARKADEFFRSIYKEQYPQAVLDFVYILNNVTDKNNKTVSKINSDITTYGLLIANLISAKSSSDAQAAIENAVLPVGSYSIKQNSYFNVSLNGYLGYAFDVNYAKGIYAPIGLSISGDIKHFIFNNLPVTAFFSLVDIGSVVSYQLSNPTANGTTSTNGTPTTSTTVNTSSLNQQIKLGSLFSPSAELLFEWRGFPLAFGGGWRRTPTLYYSGGSTYSIVGSRSVWIATILVDIPFFTFHNNPRN